MVRGGREAGGGGGAEKSSSIFVREKEEEERDLTDLVEGELEIALTFPSSFPASILSPSLDDTTLLLLALQDRPHRYCQPHHSRNRLGLVAQNVVSRLEGLPLNRWSRVDEGGRSRRLGRGNGPSLSKSELLSPLELRTMYTHSYSHGFPLPLLGSRRVVDSSSSSSRLLPSPFCYSSRLDHPSSLD